MTKKKLTTEITDYAEINIDKESRLRMHYQNGPISNPSLNDKNVKGLSEKNLCVLYFLFVHPFVFIRGGYRGKEIIVPFKGKNHKSQRSGRTQR